MAVVEEDAPPAAAASASDPAAGESLYSLAGK
jgi:hypothetical protein